MFQYPQKSMYTCWGLVGLYRGWNTTPRYKYYPTLHSQYKDHYLPTIIIWVVVSNIFSFHPYSGKWSNLTNIFQMGWNHQPVLECHKSFFFCVAHLWPLNHNTEVLGSTNGDRGQKLLGRSWVQRRLKRPVSAGQWFKMTSPKMGCHSLTVSRWYSKFFGLFWSFHIFQMTCSEAWQIIYGDLEPGVATRRLFTQPNKNKVFMSSY